MIDAAKQEVGQITYLLNLPMEGKEALLRLNESFVEFDAEFFKRFQQEVLRRVGMFRTGLDIPTAIDKFVFMILANSDVRSIE